MSVPAKGDGAPFDARLIPLLDHLAQLLAAMHVRQAEAGTTAPPAAAAPPRKDVSS